MVSKLHLSFMTSPDFPSQIVAWKSEHVLSITRKQKSSKSDEVVPADHKFWDSLSYMMRPCLEKKEKRK